MSNQFCDQIYMGLHQLVLDYTTAMVTSNFEKREEIFCEIARLPVNFDGWFKIFGWASMARDVQELALVKMMELARNLSEWQMVCQITSTDSGQYKIAIEKIRQFYGEGSQ